MLYCRGLKRVEIADVEAAIGDVSSVTSDELVDAMLSGNLVALDAAFAALLAKGTSLQGTALILARQMTSLAEQRSSMDRDGKSASTVVAQRGRQCFLPAKRWWNASSVQRRYRASCPIWTAAGGCLAKPERGGSCFHNHSQDHVGDST